MCFLHRVLGISVFGEETGCPRKRETPHCGCGVGRQGQGGGRARDEAGKGGGNYVEAFVYRGPDAKINFTAVSGASQMLSVCQEESGGIQGP